MIHTADPAAFFTPLDRFNERWHELNTHPDWLFYGEDYPHAEGTAGPVHSSGCQESEDDVHRRPFRLQCRGRGDRGEVARRASEPVHRHRRADFGAWPAAVYGAEVLHEVPGSRDVRHRHDAAIARRIASTIGFWRPTTSISTAPSATTCKASG